MRQGYELRYPDNEPEIFAGIWGVLGAPEREAYHRAGVKLLGVGENLFETNPDPTAWSQIMRAVVRFLVCHNLDPDQIVPLYTPAIRGGGRQRSGRPMEYNP